MSISRPAIQGIALGLVAGGLFVSSPARASAATCQSVATPNVGSGAQLTGVAVTSPSNAWAVGYRYNASTEGTLIEHWNGTAWTMQPSPGGFPNAYSYGLSSVAATSSSNAWAVGVQSRRADLDRALEWQGLEDPAQPSPLADHTPFSGVAATSSSNAWAVGVTHTAGR